MQICKTYIKIACSYVECVKIPITYLYAFFLNSNSVYTCAIRWKQLSFISALGVPITSGSVNMNSLKFKAKKCIILTGVEIYFSENNIVCAFKKKSKTAT